MNIQPEALLCAEALELDRDMVRRNKRAAVELRRLHALNAELLEALKAILENGTDYTATRDQARAAVTKATGETNG